MTSQLPPVSRITDPQTSRDGEKEVTDTGRRTTYMATLQQYVQDHPGETAGEIAEGTGIERWAVTKRLSDLKNQDLISQGPTRAWGGRPQVTWWPNHEPGWPTDARNVNDAAAVDARVEAAVAADPELDCGWCLWLKEQGDAGKSRLYEHQLKAHPKGEQNGP